MAKLWLEEGGKRRVFRLAGGRLSVGSGEAARLRVESADVAEVHFELELAGATARVLPRRGVLPPRIAGVAISGPSPLPYGHVLEVGGLRLWLEAEGAERAVAASTGAPRAPEPPAPVGPVAHVPPVAHARSYARRAREDADEEQDGGASRRPKRRRMPVSLYLLPAVLLIVVGLIVAKYVLGRAKPHVVAAAGLVADAERDVRDGHFELAEENLAQAESQGSLDEATHARIAALRAEMAARRAQVDLLSQNDAGTAFLETRLKKYEAKFLTGAPDPVKARLFLERCKEFRERWPKHPELPWVERQEARFRGVIDLSEPKTWPEVEWEVQDLADELPCNYVRMLEILDEFIARASDEDAAAAREKRQELVAGRPAYHADRLQQARYEYEQKDDASKAVWWLVHEVIWIGDEAMAEEAATILLDFPELERHLPGYKQTYPDRFAALMENESLLAFARSKGLAP
jgi:hypothetical protein